MTDPAPIEPAPTEPAPTDPTPTDPGSTPARLHPLTPLLRGGAFLVVVVAYLGRDQLQHPGHDLGRFGLVVLAVAVLGAGYGTVSWYFTWYRVGNDALRVDTGPIVRRQRVIRYDRLQAVDVAQPLLARLFGLADLRMDVAGGSRTEGRLGYLTLADARALRARLLAQAAGLHAATPSAPEHTLLGVPTRRVLGSTMISTPVVGALLGVAATLAVTIWTQTPIGLVVLIPIALGAITPIVRNVLNLGNFRVARSPDGLRVHHGLAGITHQTLPPGRVQGLVVKQSLLWRLLGWYRVEVDVAGMGSQDQQGFAATVVLPVGDRGDVTRVVEALFGIGDPLAVPLARAPRRAHWLRPIGARFLGWGCDEVVFVAARGWLVRAVSVVPHAKTQSVRVRQGPLARLLRLATVSVQTPAGPVDAQALHRDPDEARALVAGQIERAHRMRARAPGDRWMLSTGGDVGPPERRADAPAG